MPRQCAHWLAMTGGVTKCTVRTIPSAIKMRNDTHRTGHALKKGAAIFCSTFFSLSKNFQYTPVSGIIKETGVFLWNNGEKTQEVKQ